MSEIGTSPAGANPLMPAGVQAPQTTLARLTGATGDAHSALAAQYSKLRATESRLDVARKVMEQLVGLGDTVAQDDVVDAAGKLVAAGSAPAAIAGMLAEMPPDGEALAGWIQSKELTLQKMEAEIDQQAKAARYKMGVGALQHIAGVQVAQHFGAPAGAESVGAANPSAGTNELMPGAPQ